MLNLGPPSSESQRLLPVALLKAAEGNEIQGITRFQKLVFILQQGDLIGEEALSNEHEYDYEAHNYGPYSKELHDWLDRLDRQGVIKKKSTQTDAGNTKEIFTVENSQVEQGDFDVSNLDEELQRRVRETIEEFNQMSILELLDLVYEEYPEYAINSKL